MTLTIVGKRWFRRTYGNTYHSATMLIDGKPVGYTGQHYGYGDQYIETAFAQLEREGKIPPRIEHVNGSHEARWEWAERHGVELTCVVSDVARERDL